MLQTHWLRALTGQDQRQEGRQQNEEEKEVPQEEKQVDGRDQGAGKGDGVKRIRRDGEIGAERRGREDGEAKRIWKSRCIRKKRSKMV
jgi:hypothetical protein